MRGGSQLRRTRGVGKACYLVLFGDIEQAKSDIEFSVGQRIDRADHECLGAAARPIEKIDFRWLGREFADGAGIDDAKQTGTFEIGRNERRNVLRRVHFIGEWRNRNRHLAARAGGDVDRELGVREVGRQCGQRE